MGAFGPFRELFALPDHPYGQRKGTGPDIFGHCFIEVFKHNGFSVVLIYFN